MQDKTIEVISKIHEIEMISPGRRNEVQEAIYETNKAYLRDAWRDIFEEKTKDIFNKITHFEFSEAHYTSILFDANCQPPKIGATKQMEQLNQMIEHIYGAQTTIGPLLEELLSMRNYTESLIKRAKNILKVLYVSSDTEWKIDAVFELMLPEEVANRVHLLNYYVSAFDVRDKQLEKARRDISRLLTSYTESLKNQVESMSREVPQGLNSRRFLSQTIDK